MIYSNIVIKPIGVVDSGDTYVAKYLDTNFLCISPEKSWDVAMLVSSLEEGSFRDNFVPFKNLKITDDIAKLRPLMVSSAMSQGLFKKLYAVIGTDISPRYILHGDLTYSVQHSDSIDYRLVTYDEIIQCNLEKDVASSFKDLRKRLAADVSFYRSFYSKLSSVFESNGFTASSSPISDSLAKVVLDTIINEESSCHQL